MEKFERQYINAETLPATLLAKWSAPVLAEGFVPFPKRLLRTLGSLFGKIPEIQDLATLLSVADFKRVKPSRKPSLEYLAFVAGLTEQEYREAVLRLKERGFLSCEGDEGGLDISLDGFITSIEHEAGGNV